MKKIKYLLLVSPLLLILSCQDDEDTIVQDCPTELLCTEEFRIITVKILQNGEPVLLDYFKTVNEKTGELLDFREMQLFEDGLYPILTDSQFKDVEKEGIDFRFEGSIQDAVVVDQIYTIGHDCCHVILIDGPTTINIE